MPSAAWHRDGESTKSKRPFDRLAKEDEVSLNQWITAAVAQKIGAVEVAADFLKRQADNARPEDLDAFLAGAPDLPREPG